MTTTPKLFSEPKTARSLVENTRDLVRDAHRSGRKTRGVLIGIAQQADAAKRILAGEISLSQSKTTTNIRIDQISLSAQATFTLETGGLRIEASSRVDYTETRITVEQVTEATRLALAVEALAQPGRASVVDMDQLVLKDDYRVVGDNNGTLPAFGFKSNRPITQAEYEQIARVIDAGFADIAPIEFLGAFAGTGIEVFAIFDGTPANMAQALKTADIADRLAKLNQALKQANAADRATGTGLNPAETSDAPEPTIGKRLAFALDKFQAKLGASIAALRPIDPRV
jgi:hypothetical protein